MPISARGIKILLLFCTLVCGVNSFGSPLEDVRKALGKELARDVEFLSDSLCAGRQTGTPGASCAAFYIIHRLRSLGYELDFNSFRTERDAVGRNIIARQKGNKPAILLMASYDGLGKIGPRLYPGADSNSSGVAAMLSLAEKLKDRSDVIFAFVDGHNANMSGATALAAYFSGRRLRMVVNLDILGSTMSPPDKFWKNYLIVLGAQGWQRSLDAANKDKTLHLYYDYYGSRSFTELFYRKVSDHKVFLNRGIPVLMFTSGITMNTNREGDSFETLDYEIFADRVTLISNWLRSLQ